MNAPGLSWLFGNLRLKILAVVLAVILLLAVAFSENPLTIRQYSAIIRYANTPPEVVLIQPPTRATITVTGLSSAVRTLNDSNAFTTVDLSRIKVGTNEAVFAQPTILVSGVSIQGGAVPISLSVQTRRTVRLDVEVRFTKPTPGFAVVTDKTFAYCDNPAQPCQVSVSGPTSFLEGLVAYVEVTGDIPGNEDVPNLPVKFQQLGHDVDILGLKTSPPPGVAPPVMPHTLVTVTKTTAGKVVVYRPTVNGRQACGYVITAVTITPGNGLGLVTGPQDIVAKSPDTIDLQAVDITGFAGNAQVNRDVPLTDSSLKADPARVQVTVFMQRQVDCSAPTPTPTPSRSP